MRRCHQWSRPFLHVRERLVAAGARASHHDDHVLDGRRFLERLVRVALERNDLPASIAAVGGDDDLRLRVVHAVAQRLGREAAEHHRVNRADARAREHRDDDFGDERHVDADAIPAPNAESA